MPIARRTRLSLTSAVPPLKRGRESVSSEPSSPAGSKKRLRGSVAPEAELAPLTLSLATLDAWFSTRKRELAGMIQECEVRFEERLARMEERLAASIAERDERLSDDLSCVAAELREDMSNAMDNVWDQLTSTPLTARLTIEGHPRY